MSQQVKLLYSADVAKCIKVDDDTSGAKLVLGDADGGNGEQWNLTKEGNGMVTLQSMNGFYITYLGSKVQLQIQPLPGGGDRSAITWSVTRSGPTSVIFQTQYQPNIGEAIDNANQNDSPENIIWGYPSNGSPAQLWTIQYADFNL